MGYYRRYYPPPPPLLNLPVTTQRSLFSAITGFWASTMLIPKCKSSVIFLDFFFFFSMSSFVFGASDASATFVNIYGCVLCTRGAFSQCLKAARRKMGLHFMADCVSRCVSGILIASMNNILQVCSRSSSALPRRKPSNSRQVIPHVWLQCLKSCLE